MDEIAKNERAKSDKFALLFGDLVYILKLYHVVFFRAEVNWLKAKLNFFKVSIYCRYKN